MAKNEENISLNKVFLALADTMRRDIAELLIEREVTTVNDLCAQFPVSRFVVMRHLNILEEAGLLHRERVGNSKILHINRDNFKQLTSGWLSKMANKSVN